MTVTTPQTGLKTRENTRKRNSELQERREDEVGNVSSASRERQRMYSQTDSDTISITLWWRE